MPHHRMKVLCHKYDFTLSAASGLDVSFDFASSNVSASSGADYTSTSGSKTITAGNTSTTIPVSILSDSLYEYRRIKNDNF